MTYILNTVRHFIQNEKGSVALEITVVTIVTNATLFTLLNMSTAFCPDAMPASSAGSGVMIS